MDNNFDGLPRQYPIKNVKLIVNSGWYDNYHFERMVYTLFL